MADELEPLIGAFRAQPGYITGAQVALTLEQVKLFVQNYGQPAAPAPEPMVDHTAVAAPEEPVPEEPVPEEPAPEEPAPEEPAPEEPAPEEPAPEVAEEPAPEEPAPEVAEEPAP